MPSNDNGLISFTGPAGRTYFDRDGVLQTAGEDGIREEYDPLTGAYLGMLIESQERTNALLDSGDLSASGWQRVGSIEKESDYWVVSRAATPSDACYGIYQQNRSSGDGVAWAVIASGSSDAVELKMSDSPQMRIEVNLRTQKVTNTGDTRVISFGAIPLNDGFSLVYLSADGEGYPSGRSSGIGITPIGPTGSTVKVKRAQHEPRGRVPTSYILTGGLGVTLPGEDARFTDPAVFNDFKRGALYVDFKSILASSNPYILYRNSRARFLYYISNNLRSYDGRNIAEQRMPNGSLNKPHKYQVSWGEGSIKTNVDGSKTESAPFDGNWSGNDLIIGSGWAGYIKNLDFTPEPYTEDQAIRITKRDASTIIGECPNGGYYDYSDLSTMLVESDELGIPVEDRKIARVGDPIGAVLDKSGHGNHMTASADDRRGILRSNGGNYYIERGANTIYGFDFSGDYSLTVMIALQNYSDRFIVLCDQDGGSGNYAMIYNASSTSAHLRWSNFGSPRYYVNGKFTPASDRGDTGATLQTNPIQLRTLHRVASEYTARIFVGGYTSNNWDLTGNEYGFAWGSRLSEDDALIVEQEMRQNMPAIPD